MAWPEAPVADEGLVLAPFWARVGGGELAYGPAAAAVVVLLGNTSSSTNRFLMVVIMR